nr:TolC family protein [Roseomonas acroporae]
MTVLLAWLLAWQAADPLPAAAAGIREGFQGALALGAELRGLEAQRPVLEARRARADALLPQAPSVGGGVRQGLSARDSGYLQLEASAAAPLWLPGEAGALRGLAEAQGGANAGRIARARLLLAGQVRDAYWDWATAVAVQEAQRGRLTQTRALEADTGRGVAAGQVARADLLVAGAASREAEAALREATRAVREAAIAFRVLTGLDPTPAPPERLPERPAGEAVRPRPDDPRLAAGRAAVAAGRANERLTRVRDRDNPQLGGQLRWERERGDEALRPNLMVSGRVSLRHGPTHREALAEARAGTVAAEAELAAAERALLGGAEAAREARDASLDLARLAEARHAALAEQARLYETAYRAGQLAFIELVRVRLLLADADLARRRTRAEAGRAASSINQVLGQEP